MKSIQLTALCTTLKITSKAVYGGEIPEGWPPETHPYKVTLWFEGDTTGHLRRATRYLTVPFFMGSGHTKEPTAADVLSCITMDACIGEQSFEDFCEDFGYDVDSRKALRVYRACAKLAPRVRKFLGEHFDDVANAEH